ncbi:hypothetical protein IK146_01830 [Candidatus Saccharibacteria bacterium]|nr:hypothetical protein [Candidatus Saccharibacteria bacterium]
MLDWECTLESKWEGSFRRALGKINKLPSPIGIVVFGADCAFKNKVIDMIPNEVIDLTRNPGSDWKMRIRCGDSILICMNGDDSASHVCRHNQVQELADAKCTNVVGIYVKTDPAWAGKDGMTRERALKYSTQSTNLKNNPPTPDGLDYLITVSEKECKED